jgi:hypothetical protein
MDKVLAEKFQKAKAMVVASGFKVVETHPEVWHGKLPENEKVHCCIRKAVGTSGNNVHVDIEF